MCTLLLAIEAREYKLVLLNDQVISYILPVCQGIVIVEDARYSCYTQVLNELHYYGRGTPGRS